MSSAQWEPELDAPKPLIYLSGIARSVQLSEEEFYNRTGYRYRCSSYAYCAQGSPFFMRHWDEALHAFRKLKLHVFLDSGAHTFHELTAPKVERRRRYNVQESVKRRVKLGTVNDYLEGYIRFCRERRKQFDFYVNFDYVQRCADIYTVYRKMRESGLCPVPVYHGDDSIDWFHRYIEEGNRLIGIGWNPLANSRYHRRKYYDQIFNVVSKLTTRIYLHGFACTGTDALNYPWYSVDSTTWLKAAANGGILILKPRGQGRAPKIVKLNVSERMQAKEGLKTDYHVQELAESRGFSSEDLSCSLAARALYNTMFFRDLPFVHPGKEAKRIQWKPLV